MRSSISRRPITDRVLAQLETEGFPVGDAASPDGAYGWTGEPNAEGTTFTPWMSVSPLAARPQRISGAMADSATDWVLPYSVFYAGMSRTQCEALADKMRSALTNIEREGVVTPTGNWRIQKIDCPGIGSTNRVGSSYPDYFTQSDNFDVWVSKER